MDDPFKAGVYSGIQTYYIDAEDRVRAVARFDRAQCEAARKLPGLQKTVAAAVRRRLRYLDRVKTRIHFEDHHQDFLRWEIDGKGKVIGCEPFQRAVWVGKEIIQPARLEVGSKVEIYDSFDKSFMSIKYPIAKIERFE